MVEVEVVEVVETFSDSWPLPVIAEFFLRTSLNKRSARWRRRGLKALAAMVPTEASVLQGISTLIEANQLSR